MGVVVPGDVDAEAGRALFSANVGFRDVPLREIVAEATGLPTVLEHDVRAAGVAEQELGATAGVEDYVLAVIGTGIAAVLQTGGRAVVGATKYPGRAGAHPRVAGRRAVQLRPARLPRALRLGRGDRAALCGGAAAMPGLSAGEVLARRARRRQRGDASGPRPSRRWRWPSRPAHMLLDPALIVIGGGLSAAGNALLSRYRRSSPSSFSGVRAAGRSSSRRWARAPACSARRSWPADWYSPFP